jgi:hypothetical protein
MDVPHSAHPSPSWYGESVGHFDAEELVVDTMSLNDRTFLDDRYSVPHTTQLYAGVSAPVSVPRLVTGTPTAAPRVSEL